MTEALCPGDHLLSCLSLCCSVGHSSQAVFSTLFVLGHPLLPSPVGRPEWDPLVSAHCSHSVGCVPYVRVWHLEIRMNFHSGGAIEDGEYSSQSSWAFAVQGSWNPSFFSQKNPNHWNVVVLCLIFRIMFFSLSLFDHVNLWGCS